MLTNSNSFTMKRNLTYRDLQTLMGLMSDEQLDSAISVYNLQEDEHYTVVDTAVYIGDGVLDDGSPYLIFNPPDSEY